MNQVDLDRKVLQMDERSLQNQLRLMMTERESEFIELLRKRGIDRQAFHSNALIGNYGI